MATQLGGSNKASKRRQAGQKSAALGQPGQPGGPQADLRQLLRQHLHLKPRLLQAAQRLRVGVCWARMETAGVSHRQAHRELHWMGPFLGHNGAAVLTTRLHAAPRVQPQPCPPSSCRPPAHPAPPAALLLPAGRDSARRRCVRPGERASAWPQPSAQPAGSAPDAVGGCRP